jgi:GTP pyrophosphokinase
MTIDQITSLMVKPTMRDLSVVGKAYAFAKEAHKDHKRYSGELYFVHLFETAKIIAELGAGASAVAAGLLHDTIEDVGVLPETIRKEFGDEILMLVEGVTKLGHIRYRGVDRYSESMRRLFIASSKDLRVLIVKLADRLHNMRTLQYVPEEKRRRIAQETLEIYAPIAYRLGIRKVNRELEELSFPYADPSAFQRVAETVKLREPDLKRRLEKFHKSVLKGLAEQSIKVLASNVRIKGLYSLYNKLHQKEWDLGKIYDMLAIRIIVSSVEDCYRALGTVHGIWRPLPGRIKDYIAFPKPNGYRSLHTTVFMGDGGFVELQIRTEKMHRESEYGVAVHFGYKESKKRDVKQISRTIGARLYTELMAWHSHGATDEESALEGERTGIPHWVRELGDLHASLEEQEFWKHLREDVFKDRVFIFTPKGDVVDLPLDSSPIDFAYAIHSDIGDHLVGAKVNGKLVSIDTSLKNGDIVEILTRDAAKPTTKWLDFARTAIARKHIRAVLSRMRGK